MFNFQTGVRYNLQFYGPAILGNGLTRAKVLGTTDFTLASPVSNIAIQHVAVLPYLPAGTSRDVSKLSYVIFETETGARAAYAYAWIVESSIVVAQDKQITAVISGVGSDDLARIKDVLSLAGYNNVSLTSS